MSGTESGPERPRRKRRYVIRTLRSDPLAGGSAGGSAGFAGHRYDMIVEEARRRAAERGGDAADPGTDWLAAEAEVERRLALTRPRFAAADLPGGDH